MSYTAWVGTTSDNVAVFNIVLIVMIIIWAAAQFKYEFFER